MKPFYKLQHPGGLWRHSEAVAWYHATPLTLALYMGYGTVWHGAMPHRNRVALGLGSAMPAPECQTLGVSFCVWDLLNAYFGSPAVQPMRALEAK